MTRKRVQEHPANHERWIISYADFVTLMFALFVAMYAISLKDHTSGQRVSESVRKAVKTGGLESTVHMFFQKDSKTKNENTPPKPQAPEQPAVDPTLREPYSRLQADLKQQIDAGSVRLSLGARGLVITLQEKAFFPSGDDAIYSQAYPSLDSLAKTMATLPNPVRLEGHTDSVPIHTTRFKNNWELSTARSIALLQLLENRNGLNPERFAVAGYAQNLPIAPNDTEEGRARNRRVEIVILGGQGSPKDTAVRP